jgi:two-component system LytT family response regulator
MKIRTLILEDEPQARAALTALLGQERDLELLAPPRTGAGGFQHIARLRPDLLFLDVSAGGEGSLKLIEPFRREGTPCVIVVAASARYALAAFDAQALDYLLKPLQPGRLRRSLQRVREHFQLRLGSRLSPGRLRPLEDLESTPQYLTRVTVKHQDRVFFLPVDQIDWVEAEDNYVVLHAGRQRHFLRQTLGALEASLNPGHFCRISRSALVNLARLAELRPLFKGEYVAVLRDGSRLPITRSVEELESLLKFS